MMGKTNWIFAAALVMGTTGCVESMDSGYAAPSYGYGYGSGYGSSYSNSYYSNNYYTPQAYYSTPTVYRETRYVPVPTPVPVPVPQHQTNRSNDHRWDGHRDQPQHVDRQPSAPPPAANNPSRANNPPAGGNHRDTNRRDGSRDRDGDGRPDRRS
jgi:hypothetical protein